MDVLKKVYDGLGPLELGVAFPTDSSLSSLRTFQNVTYTAMVMAEQGKIIVQPYRLSTVQNQKSFPNARMH
jgi:hypothetical protein